MNKYWTGAFGQSEVKRENWEDGAKLTGQIDMLLKAQKLIFVQLKTILQNNFDGKVFRILE